jgi:RNA polymerase sigma factor (sigma-70 family)
MDSLADQLYRYDAMTYPENRVRVGESLIVAVYSRIAIYVGRRCPAAEVDDVVQDILVKIARGLPLAPIDSEEAFTRWCYGVARHTVADHHEKQGRKSTPLLLTEEQWEHWVETSGVGEGLDRWEKDELNLAMELLKGLSERCRHLLWSRYLEDAPIQELADTLGEGYDAVRMAIQRCLASARLILEDLPS